MIKKIKFKIAQRLYKKLKRLADSPACPSDVKFNIEQLGYEIDRIININEISE